MAQTILNEKHAETTRRLLLFYQATRVPVSLFSGNTLLQRYGSSATDYSFPLFLQSDLPKDLPRLWYATLDQNLLFGGIRRPGERVDVLFGPVLPFECTRPTAQRLLSFLGRSAADTEGLMNYFHECGAHDEDALCAAIQLFSELFLPAEQPAGPVQQIHHRWSSPFPPMPIPETEPRNSADAELEQRLLAYVRHGRVQPFEEMKQNFSSFTRRPDIAPAPIHRHYIVQALTLGSRTAVAAGVDPDLAFTLLGRYLDKLTESRSAAEYSSIFPDAFMAFAREVARIRELNCKDPLVRKIHRYIYGHIHEKITPNILANALGYNASYLCAHFKKEMGQTISSYVNACKIEEAKLLLEMPKSSITDIALQMGYPSQSYFCAVFKKVTEKTPGEYRAEFTQ